MKELRRFPRTDFHVHASYYRSEGRREEMTVSGVLRRCEEMSFEAVGVVEHLNRSPKHPLECLRALAAEAREVSSGVALFVGAELDVLDERGAVTGSEETKNELGLDYYLAAVHALATAAPSTEEFVEKNHRRLMGVVENCPAVDVIAHPWCAGRSLGAGGGWSFERVPEKYRQELTEALAGSGKAFEVNTKAERDFPDAAYRDFIRGLRDAGVKVAVGSDAHSMERVGASRVIDEFLGELGFSSGQLWTPGGK